MFKKYPITIFCSLCYTLGVAKAERSLGIIPQAEGPFNSRGHETYHVGKILLSVATERIAQAKRLTQYLRWHKIITMVQKNQIDGYWFGTYHPTPEEILLERSNPRVEKAERKQARMITQMRPLLDEHRDEENMITMVIRRAGGLSFHILARAPKGQGIEDVVDFGNPTTNYNRQDAIYFVPEQACTILATSDLFQNNKVSDYIAVARVPYRTQAEARSLLMGYSNGNIVEYAPDGKTAVSDVLHVTAGLVGAYANETKRIRISDFSDRPRVTRRDS